MPFHEALRRFITTAPAEVEACIEQAKKKKSTGGKKVSLGAPADKEKAVSLRDSALGK